MFHSYNTYIHSAMYRTREKASGGRSVLKTLDDSKQTANWGRSVQIIHEEVGTGGHYTAFECGEPEQIADHIINSCPLHRPTSNRRGRLRMVSSTIRSRPLRSWNTETRTYNYNRANDLAGRVCGNRLLERVMSPSPKSQVMFASAFS